jgi:hypothetical protein
MPETRSHRARIIGLYVAAAVAFSPVLADLAGTLVAVDGRLVILVAPALVVWTTRLQPGPGALRPRRGLALLLAGLALELFGIALDVWTIARLGLPLAALGLAWTTGWPEVRRAALLLFVVPIPISLTTATTPWLESLHARIGEALLGSGLGLDLRASGPLLWSGPDRLELYASDSGIWLAYLLAELAWLRGVLRGTPTPRLLVTCVAWALAGWPAQLLATAIASALLVAGWPAAARSWLDWGAHASIALGVALFLSRRHPDPGGSSSFV